MPGLCSCNTQAGAGKDVCMPRATVQTHSRMPFLIFNNESRVLLSSSLCSLNGQLSGRSLVASAHSPTNQPWKNPCCQAARTPDPLISRCLLSIFSHTSHSPPSQLPLSFEFFQRCHCLFFQRCQLLAQSVPSEQLPTLFTDLSPIHLGYQPHN